VPEKRGHEGSIIIAEDD